MSMERLEALHKQLDGSMNVLANIATGQLTRTHNGEVMAPGAIAWTVYRDNDCNALASKYETGATWPAHEHALSSEWLICTAGEFVITVHLPEGDAEFCLKRGSCHKLPPKVIHSARCLVAGKLFAVCVPPEQAY
jgi:quercetin dioxygenase-like cupin family protein